jgi:arylsulfatase A-like enzyme
VLLAFFATGAVQAAPKPPNILFIIMDDVGIDQMELFGYGGETPPNMPNIETIAKAGIRFSNTWAMPACSPSRAVFFTGRFPLRTNVYGALGPDDLANAQVSPFEVSLPSLLKQRGYQSALFGKFHLGLQGTNPFHDAMPRSLGWDYYYGWLDPTGDPSSIDTTAGTGGADEKGPYSCGFVPGAAQGGADFGACYAADGACTEMALTGGVPPGRSCRDGGGIFDPGQACQLEMPANIESGFQNLSAHYVSPLVINEENGAVVNVPPTDIRARSYRGSIQVDAAIDWIKRQPKHQPWMASVSFSTAHTPVMQPPQELLTSNPAVTSNLSCATSMVEMQRELTNLMIEALDTEFARLLVSVGVARRGHDGRLKYNPNNNDTMIVILGDNGTLGTAVKLPFDLTRAKGTAYQTGVWVPLIVAGPQVKKPDRSVTHMVNIADLYQLFGELAGIDVPASVPHTLDSMAMLPYLTNPKQNSIRSFNFTQVGPNTQAEGAINGPCTIGTSCTHIPVSKTVCEDNNGTWWGKGADDPATAGIPLPDGLQQCCEVNQFLYSKEESLFSLQPLRSIAIRNERFKLVTNSFAGDPSPDADAPEPPGCDAEVSEEFYAIDEAAPLPRIDRAGFDLLKLPGLTPEQHANYLELSAELLSILSSQPPCIGDGNIDGVVDALDEADWADFAELSLGESSWFDIDLDGFTDATDLAIIAANQGTACGQ